MKIEGYEEITEEEYDKLPFGEGIQVYGEGFDDCLYFKEVGHE